MIRDGKWKLVRYFNNPWELYDIEQDRSESHNLAEQNPEIVKQLGTFYDKWATRVGCLPWSEAKNYSVYPKGKYNF